MSVVRFIDSSFRNEMYCETTSSSMKSRGVVIRSLMWLFERRKTGREITSQHSHNDVLFFMF